MIAIWLSTSSIACCSLKRSPRVWPIWLRVVASRDNEIGSGCIHRSLLNCYLNPVGLRVQLDQHITFLDPIVVVDQNVRDLSTYPRRHKRDVAVHVGIIGRDGTGMHGTPME